jgi:NADH:ubiquinone oxidoreductase subunit E
MYNLKPVGKMHLKICTNVACCLRGSDELMSFAEKKLNIRCGETTSDGQFTLSEEECLGACTTAPAMMANDDYVENLSVESLNRFIEQESSKMAGGRS